MKWEVMALPLRCRRVEGAGWSFDALLILLLIVLIE